MAVDVKVDVCGGGLVVHSLVAGDPADLRRFILAVKEIAGYIPVFVSVDIGNQKMEKLLTVYEGLGAVPKSVLLEVQNG